MTKIHEDQKDEIYEVPQIFLYSPLMVVQQQNKFY